MKYVNLKGLSDFSSVDFNMFGGEGDLDLNLDLAPIQNDSGMSMWLKVLLVLTLIAVFGLLGVCVFFWRKYYNYNKNQEVNKEGFEEECKGKKIKIYTPFGPIEQCIPKLL